MLANKLNEPIKRDPSEDEDDMLDDEMLESIQQHKNDDDDFLVLERNYFTLKVKFRFFIVKKVFIIIYLPGQTHRGSYDH